MNEYRGVRAWVEIEDDLDAEDYVVVQLFVEPTPRGIHREAYSIHVKTPLLQNNPEPLAVVERRDNVTALAAIRGRSREDRLRVWLALGGTEEDFPVPVAEPPPEKDPT